MCASTSKTILLLLCCYFPSTILLLSFCSVLCPFHMKLKDFCAQKRNKETNLEGKIWVMIPSKIDEKKCALYEEKLFIFFSCYLYFFSTLQKAINHVLDTNELICWWPVCVRVSVGLCVGGAVWCIYKCRASKRKNKVPVKIRNRERILVMVINCCVERETRSKSSYLSFANCAKKCYLRYNCKPRIIQILV